MRSKSFVKDLVYEEPFGYRVVHNVIRYILKYLLYYIMVTKINILVITNSNKTNFIYKLSQVKRHQLL